MKQRSTAPARALATIALIVGFVVFIVVISASLGGSGDSKKATSSGEVTRKSNKAKGKTKAAAYVVQNGDTLTSIARKTGLSVTRLQELNPSVDPQILISGEKLKLR